MVRGCTCAVDGSVDGQTWVPLGRSTGFSTVVPARTGVFRHVRVTGSLSDLREVSVWDADASTAPPPPAPRPSGTSLAPGGAAPAVTPPDSANPSRQVPALAALAALLLAAAAAAVAAARGRR